MLRQMKGEAPPEEEEAKEEEEKVEEVEEFQDPITPGKELFFVCHFFLPEFYTLHVKYCYCRFFVCVVSECWHGFVWMVYLCPPV